MKPSTTPKWIRWLEQLIQPNVWNFWAAKISPSLSWNTACAKVISRQVEAEGIITLVLQPNRLFRGYKSGQHVNITMEVNGVRYTRCYSPNTPYLGPRFPFAITVKKVPGGLVSPELCTHTKVGDILELGIAFGQMNLEELPQAKSWLFLAGGVGITPLMSLLRALAQKEPHADISLIYWAKNRAQLCFFRELTELSQKMPKFQVQFALSGRADQNQLKKMVPDLHTRSVLACGPDGFIQHMKDLCAEAPHFLAESQMHSPPAALGEKVKLLLARSGREFALPQGQRILPFLEAQGITPKFGCRMGLCRTCTCLKLSGSTIDTKTGTKHHEANDEIQICSSTAISDLSLDL